MAANVAAEVDVEGTFEIAELDLVGYRLQLQVRAFEVQTRQRGKVVDDGQVVLLVENGVASVSELRASAAGGTVELDGSVDLAEGKSANLRAKIRGVQLDRLGDFWPEMRTWDGKVSADGDLRVWRQAAGFAIGGNVNGEVQNPTAQGMAIDSLSFQLDLAEMPIRLQPELPQAEGTLDLQLQTQQTDLAAVVAQIRGDKPSWLDTLAGRLSLKGSVRIPLSTMRQPETYVALFDMQAERLAVAGQTLRRAVTKGTLTDGRLVCESVSVDLSPSGRVQGRLELDLATDGLLQAEADFEQLPASLLARELDEPVNKLQGELSGNLAVRIPTAEWNRPQSWQVTASLKSSQLELEDLVCEKVTAGLRMTDGQVRVDPLRMVYQTATLGGKFRLSLNQPYHFQGRMGVRRAKVAELLQPVAIHLPAPVDGLAAGQASLSGTLRPLDWHVQGEIGFSPLQMGEWKSDRVAVQWQLDAQQLRITKATADLAGSALEATGTIPLVSDAKSRIEGSFRDFPLSQLATRPSEIPVSLSGTMSGRFAVTQIESPDQIAVDLEFQGGQAKSVGVACEQLNGRAGWRAGQLDLAIGGRTLGGQFSVTAQGTLSQEQPQPTDLSGSAQLKGLQLVELWSALGQRQRWGDLQGTGSVDLKFDLSRRGADPWAEGTMRLGNVRFAARPLTQEARARLELNESVWQIRDARCRLADGTLTAELRGRLSGGPAEFRVQADGVSLRPLLAFWPKGSRRVAGTLDADFRGTVAQRCDGRGVLRISRANLAGVPVSSVRIPAAWSVWPATGRGQARLDLDAVLAGSGRAKAKGQLGWNRRLSLKGSGRVEQLDLQDLARSTRMLNDSLSGKLSGNVAFEGRSMRSIEDLSGSFDARLVQSQTLLLPVLEALTGSLGIPSPGSATFAETKMQGNFRQGSVRIEQMVMEGPSARMWVDGRLSYTGRLNFNVTADTGQLSAVNVAFGLVNPLQLLRQRLIFLEITGNISSPIVQPRVAEALAQEVVLFFLPVISVR
jgi:hypothetical protein